MDERRGAGHHQAIKRQELELRQARRVAEEATQPPPRHHES